MKKWVKGKCYISQVGQFYAKSLLDYSLIYVRNSPCPKFFSGKAVCHNIPLDSVILTLTVPSVLKLLINIKLT